MIKTTVYLPEELESRLDAEAAATGVSKAELIRQSIALLLEHSAGASPPMPSLPVFNSGRPMSPEEMDEAIYEHLEERTARR